MSACDACQGAKWFSWKAWSRNCTAVDPTTTFSNLIPSGTRVQEWAFLDVTDEGTWDPVLAYQVGDATEVNAGQPGTLAAPATPTTTQTAVPGLSSTQVAIVSHGSSSSKKIGAIVGGVLGGLAFIAATVALLLWRARVRRRTATRVAAEAMFPGRTALPLQEKLGKKEEPAAVEPVGAEAI
ncbi:hypothetical protein EDB85DRAFT_2000123 [Lactarius pseudohatsudake]|nr:hypothetical protein EDB85DRAFT_2000123 [Lactarius pseudohatsudake]